jgi:hypothetical protein
MERNIISWNITNWITVILMVGVGYVAIAAVVSLASQWSSPATPAASKANGTSLAT